MSLLIVICACIKDAKLSNRRLFKSTASPKELLALVTNYPALFVFHFVVDDVTVG